MRVVVFRGIIVPHALNGVGGVGDFRVRRNQSPFFEGVPHVFDCSVFVGDAGDVAANHLLRLHWYYRLFPLEVIAEIGHSSTSFFWKHRMKPAIAAMQIVG